jgi:conjugative transfer signal peptidase TraF
MKRFAQGALSLFALSALLGLASFPVGLYWQVARPAGKGNLVVFCPPQEPVFTAALARGYLSPGFCPGGSSALIKRVVAFGGDHVVVNGVPVANSRQRAGDPSGRPLPAYRGDFVLADDQVLLMSDHHPDSFDGRYFGPVDRAHLQGVVIPVFVLGRPAPVEHVSANKGE